MQLRYGMNPHQAARVTEVSGRAPVRIVSGEPSYLNLLDVLNASQLVREAAAATGSPVATSFKHVSPADVATAGAVDDTARETWGLTAQVGSLTSAYVRARDSDPKSSFGDVIAVSEPVDAELAELLSRVVADGIVAPGYELGTVEVLSRKKRGTFLVAEADPGYRAPVWERHDVHGLVLEQERDQAPITADLLRASESGELVAAGTVGDALGRETTEKDEPDTAGIAAFRIVGERACLDFAARGVRASVVRLAPTVHGPGDYGFIGMLIATARKTGVSAYVGDGGNRWPAVHRLDAAILFRLALEEGPAGSVLHGVAESGVTMKSIAETIARGLDLPAVSLTPDEAAANYASPFMATVYGFDAPVSSSYTQELLGWSPIHPTLLEDLEHGDYFAAPIS